MNDYYNQLKKKKQTVFNFHCHSIVDSHYVQEWNVEVSPQELCFFPHHWKQRALRCYIFIILCRWKCSGNVSEKMNVWISRYLNNQNTFEILSTLQMVENTSLIHQCKGCVNSIDFLGSPVLRTEERKQGFGTTEIETRGMVLASFMCTPSVITFLLLLLLYSQWFLLKHTFQFHFLVEQIPEMR